MKIVAIVQARLSSSRLPGKMLMPIFEHDTLVTRVLKQVSKSKMVDQVVLATSDELSDSKLCEEVISKGYKAYKGSLNDVLKRFYNVAEGCNADVVIRITGDCPCITGDWIDLHLENFIKLQKEEDIQYLGYPENLPDGLDLEIFSFNALKQANTEASLESEREHVTPYIWKHPEIFKQKKIDFKDDYSIYKLSVDTKDDYNFIKSFLINNRYESYKDLLLLLSNKKEEFVKHALKGVKNEGLYKSLSSESSIPKIALGLASVGQSYGWKSSAVHGDYSKYFDLFYSALASGIDVWDTAPAYGESEKIIGNFISKTNLKPKILTKVTINKSFLLETETSIYNKIKDSVSSSVNTLNATPYCIQVHNADEELLKSDEIFASLQKVMSDFNIPVLGVTVYGEDLLFAVVRDEIKVIQVEYNFTRTKMVDAVKDKIKDKVLITRSTYNKGLFTISDISELNKNFENIKYVFIGLLRLATENNMSLAEVSFRYVLSNSSIGYALLGMNNPDELNQNIEIYKKGPLPNSIKSKIDEMNLNNYWPILDPRRW